MDVTCVTQVDGKEAGRRRMGTSRTGESKQEMQRRNARHMSKRWLRDRVQDGVDYVQLGAHAQKVPYRDMGV